MSLSLNLPKEGDRYRVFFGRNIDQMPLLVASGRVPLSTKQLMERRIEVQKPDFGKEYKGTPHEASIQAVHDEICMNYVDTGDGVLYGPNGKIKVVTDAAFLRALMHKSQLQNGAVVLTDDLYRETNAPEFTRDQVEKDLFGTVWLALARDGDLLGEYREAVAEEQKTRHGYEGENMAVWLAPAQKVTTGRLWVIDGNKGISSANGNSDLNRSNSRLLGVASGAQDLVRGAPFTLAHPKLEAVVARLSGYLQGRTDLPTEDDLRELLAPLYKQ